MNKISVKTFYDRVHSFRKKLGTTGLAEDQYQNLKKMFVLSYLNVDQDDPDFDEEKIVNIFESNLNEYVRRMFLMGMEP